MATRKCGIPASETRVLTKSDLLHQLKEIDNDNSAINKILKLEMLFRERISSHVGSLPTNKSSFHKFKTNPFVLMMQCLKMGYAQIKEIESDILPAKVFSSMETSAGKMIEDVMLPMYGWECVSSGMHTKNSVLDGKKREGNVLKLATLKSGPSCLNDEMSENFADSIVTYAKEWAVEANVKKIDFSYGVLYGTQKMSNKKDWHILRKIKDKVSEKNINVFPENNWCCSFNVDDVVVNVTIRIGLDWWQYLGGKHCFLELALSLLRACVKPAALHGRENGYVIFDLGKIVSMRSVPENFNVSVVQRSQIEWLFFFSRHFCDEIVES